MIFDIQTHKLYSERGGFLKKLECPVRKQWADLKIDAESRSRICDTCTKPVYDTGKMTEGEVIQLLKASPQACLKIDLNQSNIQIL